MSLLLRLLTTGKSLVGLRDQAHRYRLDTQSLLPKFGSDKNPFAEGTVRSQERESGNTQRNPTKSAEDHPVQKESLSGRDAKAHGGQKKSGIGLFRGWFGRGTSQPSKPGAPAIKSPIQYELSLDRVKVVRNDLSDTDLEIVTRKPGAARLVAPVLPAAKTLSQVPTRVGRATIRLLDALKT
jgi:hypothetical protein